MENSLRWGISRIYGRIGNDFMNQNETQWDKLLEDTKPPDGTILVRISIDIHMSRRSIVYWSGWQTMA